MTSSLASSEKFFDTVLHGFCLKSSVRSESLYTRSFLAIKLLVIYYRFARSWELLSFDFLSIDWETLLVLSFDLTSVPRNLLYSLSLFMRYSLRSSSWDNVSESGLLFTCSMIWSLFWEDPLSGRQGLAEGLAAWVTLTTAFSSDRSPSSVNIWQRVRSVVDDLLVGSCLCQCSVVHRRWHRPRRGQWGRSHGPGETWKLGRKEFKVCSFGNN